MKRLTNTLLAACIAGSTVFSSMSFLKAEEQVNLDDGLKNYWNFENVDVGATDILSNDGKNTNAVLEGSGVAIEQRDEVFGKVLHFGNVNDSCMKISKLSYVCQRTGCRQRCDGLKRQLAAHHDHV